MENEYSGMNDSKRLISIVGIQIFKSREKLIFRNLEGSDGRKC